MATTEIPKLAAEKRERLGSRECRRIRETGEIPAVVYGHGLGAMPIRINQKEVIDLLHRHVHLVEINVRGTPQPCLIKDRQWDYLGTNLIHVDLERVDPDEKVTSKVGIEVTGEAVGLKEAGAFLETPTTELEIECKATDIPGVIQVDVSELGVGQMISVSDLNLPEGVVAKTDGDAVVATVNIGAVVEDEDGEAEASDAEPEVIGEKKDDAEEGDG